MRIKRDVLIRIDDCFGLILGITITMSKCDVVDRSSRISTCEDQTDFTNLSANYISSNLFKEQDKKEQAEREAMRYHKIRSGDTLGAIARKYGTTVNNICRLNGIKPTTILRIGRTLRVR